MKKLIIVAAIVAAGVGGFSYANHVASEKVKAEVDKQLALVSDETGAQFEYDNVSANIFSNSMQISGMTVISPEGLKVANIESIHVSGYETDKISEHTSFDIANFTFSEEISAELPSDINPKLLAASYNLHSALYYDDNSGESDIVFKIGASDIVDMGMDVELASTKALMDLSLELQKIQQSQQVQTYEQELQQQTKLMQALSTIETRSVKFAIKNTGSLKDVVSSELEAQGMTLEQVQQLAQQQFQQLPIPAEVTEQLMGFVMGLNNFTLSASLPKGKTITEVSSELTMLLSQPEELVKYLNLDVSGS